MLFFLKRSQLKIESIKSKWKTIILVCLNKMYFEISLIYSVKYLTDFIVHTAGQ